MEKFRPMLLGGNDTVPISVRRGGRVRSTECRNVLKTRKRNIDEFGGANGRLCEQLPRSLR